MYCSGSPATVSAITLLHGQLLQFCLRLLPCQQLMQAGADSAKLLLFALSCKQLPRCYVSRLSPRD